METLVEEQRQDIEIEYVVYIKVTSNRSISDKSNIFEYLKARTVQEKMKISASNKPSGLDISESQLQLELRLPSFGG